MSLKARSSKDLVSFNDFATLTTPQTRHITPNTIFALHDNVIPRSIAVGVDTFELSLDVPSALVDCLPDRRNACERLQIV